MTLGERPEEVLQGTPHPSEPSGADDLGTARGILAGLAYSTISSTLRSFRVALPARRAPRLIVGAGPTKPSHRFRSSWTAAAPSCCAPRRGRAPSLPSPGTASTRPDRKGRARLPVNDMVFAMPRKARAARAGRATPSRPGWRRPPLPGDRRIARPRGPAPGRRCCPDAGRSCSHRQKGAIGPERRSPRKCLHSRGLRFPIWSEREDSNLRPLRPEHSALPG